MAAKSPPKAPRRTAEDEKYPNLAAQKDWDKAEHVKRSMEAGLSKKEALRHAQEEVGED